MQSNDVSKMFVSSEGRDEGKIVFKRQKYARSIVHAF